jgi:hypothetical protein
MKEFMNLFLFIAICFLIYILFRNFNYGYKEGMTDDSGNKVTPPLDGFAGNAASYGATIKATNIKLQDIFLISKYRADYETVILNMDDLLNSLMLQTTLSVDTNNPQKTIKSLAEMNQAKLALNSVMKYIDKQ